MVRTKEWWGRNWTQLVLTGIFVALAASVYFSYENNRILTRRNQMFQQIRDEIAARCR